MPLYLLDGKTGSGKSAGAAQICWNAARRGERVYSNTPAFDMRLNDWGRPFSPATFGWPWATYLHDVGDLLQVRRGYVWLDEVDVWFAAVDWSKFNASMRSFWTQSRKHDLTIIMTCTHIDRLFNVARDIVDTRATCVRFPFPFLRGYSVQKLTDPQATRSTRKSVMWRLVKLDKAVFSLYQSAFIVAKEGGEMGSVDYGNDIPVWLGSEKDAVEFASRPGTVRPARKGESFGVAPLMRPADVRALATWYQGIAEKGVEADSADRVAVRRLGPVMRRLMGRHG